LNTTIDLRAHDTHEHGLTMTQRVMELGVDMQMAQRIRDGLQKKREDEAFAEAEKRMRSPA
jgi:hypothetical protein